MSLSTFAKQIVSKVFTSMFSKGEDGKVTYDLEINDSRADSDIMTSSFKFKRGLTQAELDKALPQYMEILQTQMSARRLGVVSAVLSRAGLDPSNMGKSTKVSGSINVTGTGTEVPKESDIESLTSIRTKSGRFMSIPNFLSLLNLSSKAYMVQGMVSPALVFRTGRFVANTKVTAVQILRPVQSSRPTLLISFTYMHYPYETFDPDGPNSRGLATVDRNPRKIIGDAITKALDDLVSELHYDIRIQSI